MLTKIAFAAIAFTSLSCVVPASHIEVKPNAPVIKPLKHEAVINRLIACESSGVNISRPDSNGRISDGILQFNRGPSNVLGSGTWAHMSALSNIKGSPLIPGDAKRMADWMISAGYGPRWTCWRIIGLHYGPNNEVL